jgi:hypothetical protein
MEGDCLWFLPTVAWPSEAVRAPDESITSIHKRVAAPFYVPRGVARLINAQTQHPSGLISIGPTACAGWLTGKRNRLETFHNTMEGDCLWFLPTVAWPSEAVRAPDVSITSITQRVAAPFYEPRGVAGLINTQTQRPGGLI